MLEVNGGIKFRRNVAQVLSLVGVWRSEIKNVVLFPVKDIDDSRETVTI